MSKSLSVWLLFLLLPHGLFGQATPPGPPTEANPRAVAQSALEKARAGENTEALALYRRALEAAPNDPSILRDYAVVLGWAEQYSEASEVIDRLQRIEPTQPDWALSEFARTYLFGDKIDDALSTLNELVERGDISELTLNRRAMALRWLSRSSDSETAYREVVRRYPDSGDGLAGLAYVISDQNRLPEALRLLDSASGPSSRSPQALKARIRILNWMGRHYEAGRLIASLPSELQGDREILEDRINASRWGGDPNAAMQNLDRLLTLFPSQASDRMERELRTEFGHSIVPYFRIGKDSDGLIDRSSGTDIAIHLNPAHTLRVGYQYRWLSQQDIRSLVRYDIGWSGSLNRRTSIYTTAANVDYRTPGASRKTVGDASLSIAASDSVRLAAGGGAVVMDAYQALPNQVTGPFAFGDAAVVLHPRSRVQGRYSRYWFSNDVNRDRADFQFQHSLLLESAVRLDVGWRSSLMWHDVSTGDFYSPTSFGSHVAVTQLSGRIVRGLEYYSEVAGGWQSEPNTPVLHPLQTSGRIVWQPGRHFRTVVEAAKSTSSLDRATPGFRAYSRWTVGGSIEFRFP